MTPPELANRRCVACEGGVPKLDDDRVAELLRELPFWHREGKVISRVFRFRDYHHTMAFVNAVAWVAHVENHHPDMLVSYNTCRVSYHTHAVDGLTENDFICAAKVDRLME